MCTEPQAQQEEPQAPQDRPQAQQEAAEDLNRILTQAPGALTARKRSLLDMSENMHMDLAFGLHPAVPAAMAARPVLMNPTRPDGPGPQGENLRQVMSPKSDTMPRPSGSTLSSSSGQAETGEASAKRFKENQEKMIGYEKIREEIKGEIRNEVKSEYVECIKKFYQAATVNMEENKKQLTKMISGQLSMITDRQNELERAAKEMYKGLHHEIGLLKVQESEKVRMNLAWKDEIGRSD